MPISDAPDYELGHFQRVYEHLIVPACEKAGYKPLRADDTKAADFILLGILKAILASDMCICDLSTRNPNVMFELGLRQASNKPVALIRDVRTPRVFDVQGIRDVEYEPTLRIDFVKPKVDEIADAIKQKARLQAGDVNSLVELLNISPASPPPQSTISSDTALILNELGVLKDRLTALEHAVESEGGVRGDSAGQSYRLVSLLPQPNSSPAVQDLRQTSRKAHAKNVERQAAKDS